MKAFLKIVLLVVLAVIAVKLLPLTFAVGCVLALGVLALTVVGVSLVTAVIAAVIALVVGLSPILIPALAIVGLVALLKKQSNGRAAGA